MSEFIDQTGRKVLLGQRPQRIISTVPSQTELLYDLGLEKQVVGITAYCCHPRHWLTEKTVIGGTKDLQVDKIKSLKPDLIIGNKEENVKEQIEELETAAPVWLSDIRSIDDALEMIGEVGKITGTSEEANKMLRQLEQKRSAVKPGRKPLRTAYFIWKDPYMVISPDTFIHSMLSMYGFESLPLPGAGRYPEVELMELAKMEPELVLLSSEPYNFSVGEMQEMARYFPGAVLKIVDGELLSWYGSRLLKAFDYLRIMRSEADLIFPDIL